MECWQVVAGVGVGGGGYVVFVASPGANPGDRGFVSVVTGG